MKKSSYYRAASTFPLLVPLLLEIFDRVTDVTRNYPNFSFVIDILLGGAVVVGPVYVLLTALALIRLRKSPPESYERLARWAPVFLGCAMIPIGLIYGAVTGFEGTLGAVAGLFLVTTGVGYAYVFAAFVLCWLLEEAGVVSDHSHDDGKGDVVPKVPS